MTISNTACDFTSTWTALSAQPIRRLEPHVLAG
jgi:hypothetical protein